MSAARPLVETRLLGQPQAMMPISGILMTLAMTVGRWELQLRTRKSLAKLDDRLLHDIGLTRDTAQVELDKHFWWS